MADPPPYRKVYRRPFRGPALANGVYANGVFRGPRARARGGARENLEVMT